MRNITKTKRQQNQGFSLFTVLIAVSFVGILGLLVLYIALSNFNMKITDLKGKDSDEHARTLWSQMVVTF